MWTDSELRPVRDRQWVLGPRRRPWGTGRILPLSVQQDTTCQRYAHWIDSPPWGV